MSSSEVSASDSEDEEYFPEGDAQSSASDASVEGVTTARKGQRRGGRKKRVVQPTRRSSRKRRGGIRLMEESDEEEEEEEEEGEEEEEESEGGEEEDSEDEEEKEGKQEFKEKSRIDNLWESFKKDTDSQGKPASAQRQSPPKTKMVTIKKAYDFAGEEVIVEEKVAVDSKEAQDYCAPQETSTDSKETDNMATTAATPLVVTTTVTSTAAPAPVVVSSAARSIIAGSKRSSGVGSILQSLQKKPKMSTLEKSSIDWASFKEGAGLEDELSQQRKDGYLQKQEFLHRVDQREFELERDERLKRFKRLH